MIALIENHLTHENYVVSALSDARLRDQIERLLRSNISSTAWAKLYVDMDTADFGMTSVTLFKDDSILVIKPMATTSITREDHNLKPTK